MGQQRAASRRKQPGSGIAASSACAAPRRGEVACEYCGLDVLCLPLEYGEEGAGVPEGILLRRQPLGRGEALFRAGDPFRSFYAVKSGALKAQAPGGAFGDRVLGFFLPGELIGVEGMAGQSYPYTARALEPSAVCELCLDRLAETGRSLEALQRGVIRVLGEQVALQQALIGCLVRQHAGQLVAGFLLDVARRLRQRGLPATEFSLPMSRSDIASHLGLAGETVSRQLTLLQKRGGIAIRGKRLTLLRPDRLESMLDIAN